MKVSVLSLAKNDLKEIRLFLSEYGENPPEKFRESFEKFCAQVVDMPYMFSQYEYITSYRKAVIAFDYLVFYRIDESKGKIMVYRVLHGKRNIAPLLD
jgi:plasmid stabilization system protein ParE